MFCDRLGVPPWALWKGLPGFDRLQLALDLATKAAFVPEGMVRYLNRIRPEGQPKASLANLVTAGRLADGLEDLFQQRAAWWGGQ